MGTRLELAHLNLSLAKWYLELLHFEFSLFNFYITYELLSSLHKCVPEIFLSNETREEKNECEKLKTITR